MIISTLDIILFNICSYLFGIATGLTICCKYKDSIMKSKSHDNIRNLVNDTMNHQNIIYPPQAVVSPILASAPTPEKLPVKLTIE